MQLRTSGIRRQRRSCDAKVKGVSESRSGVGGRDAPRADGKEPHLCGDLGSHNGPCQAVAAVANGWQWRDARPPLATSVAHEQ